jgi:hypothetical protein
MELDQAAPESRPNRESVLPLSPLAIGVMTGFPADADQIRIVLSASHVSSQWTFPSSSTYYRQIWKTG